MKKFPKTMLITQEQDGGDTYFISSTDVDDLPTNFEAGKVAVYQLVEVKTLKVEKTLISEGK